MPTVPANYLFTMIILHCFLGCKEPLYQENLKLGQSDKRGKNETEIKSAGLKSQFFKQANFECPKKAILDPLFYNPRSFWWFIFYERPNIWWLKQFLFSKIFKIKPPERSEWTQFDAFVCNFSMGLPSWWYSTIYSSLGHPASHS